MALGGQLTLKLEGDAAFDRARFVLAPFNQDAAEALDVWPSRQTGPLALIGPPGSGKTHLALAWARRTGAQALSPADIDAGGAWPPGPLLLEDADQVFHGEGFFHLLNASLRPGACLLMTGRTRPAAWPVEVQDLRSRLNAAPVVELAEPDEQMLKEMLLKLFQQRNIRAPDDLLAYLVLRIERSAAAAAGIVKALDEASLPDQRGVSRVLARQLLKDEPDDGDADPRR